MYNRLVATPAFMLAILWDEMALLQAIQRVLSELESTFQPPVVSNLSLTLSPAMACLHFNVEFSSYSRGTLTHLEGETKRSGGRLIELLRIPAPADRIGHAELRFGDSVVMLADEFPDMGARSPQSLGGSPVRSAKLP